MSEKFIEIKLRNGSLQIDIDNGLLTALHVDEQGHPQRFDSFGHEDLVNMLNWVIYTRENGMPAISPGNSNDRLDDFLSKQHYERQEDLTSLGFSEAAIQADYSSDEIHFDVIQSNLIEQITILYECGGCSTEERIWLDSHLDSISQRYHTRRDEWEHKYGASMSADADMDLIHAVILFELERYNNIGNPDKKSLDSQIADASGRATSINTREPAPESSR